MDIANINDTNKEMWLRYLIYKQSRLVSILVRMAEYYPDQLFKDALVEIQHKNLDLQYVFDSKDEKLKKFDKYDKIDNGGYK